MEERVRQLLIVGAGGFGRETAEVAHAVNARHPTWTLLGFLDDDTALAGKAIEGVPVLGPIALVERYPEAALVVSTGNPRDHSSRQRITERMNLPDSRYATLVHPRAVLPRSVTLGVGTVILANAVATAGVRMGNHTVVMPGAVMTHDVVIGDYVTIGAGVCLAGGVTVADGAYIGAGALIREGCAIGPRALIGMGAVVLNDVPTGEVWAGVPARRLRSYHRSQ